MADWRTVICSATTSIPRPGCASVSECVISKTKWPGKTPAMTRVSRMLCGASAASAALLIRDRSGSAFVTIPGLQRTTSCCAAPGKRLCSIQRLDLHDPVVVITADPERHRARRVVDEHRGHVGGGRAQILHGSGGCRVDA